MNAINYNRMVNIVDFWNIVVFVENHDKNPSVLRIIMRVKAVIKSVFDSLM